MIKIICIGKIKEKYLVDAINEYMKRIQKYSKVEIIELSDESQGETSKILKLEAEKIEKYLSPKDFIISLEIEGKSLNSLELANLIDQKLVEYSNITFIIGGSYGIDESIKKKVNYHLSFSKMTFPHQLFRLLLLEQIYRSFKINNNESYHK
ncbi:MAG: 23S rRNA (pseudouridine(1915)-N(3))-methyltransferase RlmH [Bacilli bacterium]|nr:23S rRNA (pseudouridine(1915)-N(3))-methyltransferase RlmH [Bacilli bacterium]